MPRNDWPDVIDLRHIRLVAALTDHGTVTAAARALSLSQSALSHQLRELETQLRTPLYVRTARRMIPTAAGEELAAVVSKVARDLRHFEQKVRGGSFDEARGEIRFVVEGHSTYHWSPPVLRAFSAEFPGVDIQLRPEAANSVMAALRSGTVDMALAQSASADRRIRTRLLFEDEYVAVASAGHDYRDQAHVDLEDVAAERLLVNGAGPDSPILDEILRPAGVAAEQVTFVPLTEALLELVAADMGVAILPSWVVRPWLGNGRIVTKRLTESGIMRRWYVATRADDLTTPYHERFIALMGCAFSSTDAA